jgi:hypothetical protein
MIDCGDVFVLRGNRDAVDRKRVKCFEPSDECKEKIKKKECNHGKAASRPKTKLWDPEDSLEEAPRSRTRGKEKTGVEEP